MQFREEDHSYIHEGIKYSSVTGLYGQFKRKKDWEAIAEAYAIKNGEDAAYWLKVWEDNRNKAAEFGSLYHLTREFGTTQVSTPEVKFSVDLSALENGIYKELIVYSHYYKVAGQIDVVSVKDGIIRIRDYKTCKTIETEAFKKFIKGRGRVAERYLPPISHLEVFNLNDFALQLSLYGFLLEEYGYKVERLIIEHIEFKERDKGYESLIAAVKSGKIQQESTDYEVPYYKEEARAILTHHRNSLVW
jgi:hypothetical protein